MYSIHEIELILCIFFWTLLSLWNSLLIKKKCRSLIFRSTVEPDLSFEEDITQYIDDSIQADSTQLNTKTSEKMAAESKEARPDEPLPVTKSTSTSSASDDSLFNLMYSIVKKVSLVGAIYIVGYMNWSVAWLITPVILAVTREYWRKNNAIKREVAKASATANEKDVILARISDLPAWVSLMLFIFSPFFISQQQTFLVCFSIGPISRFFLKFNFFRFQVYFPDIERCEWINRVSITIHASS